MYTKNLPNEFTDDDLCLSVCTIRTLSSAIIMKDDRSLKMITGNPDVLALLTMRNQDML